MADLGTTRANTPNAHNVGPNDTSIADSLMSGQLCDFWYVVMTFLTNRELIVLAGTCRRLRKLVSAVIPSRASILYHLPHLDVVPITLFSAHTDFVTYGKFVLTCAMCGELLGSTNQYRVHITSIMLNPQHCGHKVPGSIVPMKTNDVCKWIVFTGTRDISWRLTQYQILTRMIVHGVSADLGDVQIDKITAYMQDSEHVIHVVKEFCNVVANLTSRTDMVAADYRAYWRALPARTLKAGEQLIRRYTFVHKMKTEGTDIVARFALYVAFCTESEKMDEWKTIDLSP